MERKKKGVVAQSNLEAEYIEMYFAVRGDIWIRKIYEELLSTETKRMIIREEKQHILDFKRKIG